MSSSVILGMGSAAVLALAGVALLVMGRSAARGSLPRNNSFGIRTRWTLASDAAWEAGHRAAGHQVRSGSLGALIGAVIGVGCGFLPLAGVSESATNTVITVCILSSCAWLLAWLLVAGTVANRAARAADTAPDA